MKPLPSKAVEFVVQKVQQKAQEKASEMFKKLAIADDNPQQQPPPPANTPYAPHSYYQPRPPESAQDMSYPPSPYTVTPSSSASHPHPAHHNAAPSVSATYTRPPSQDALPSPSAHYGQYNTSSLHERPPNGESIYPQPSHYESPPPPSPSPSQHSSAAATDPLSVPPYATMQPARPTPNLNKLPPAAYQPPPHSTFSPTNLPEEYPPPRPHHSPHPYQAPNRPSPNQAPMKPSISYNSEGDNCSPSSSHAGYPQPGSDPRPNLYYPQPPNHQPTTTMPAKNFSQAGKSRPTTQKVTQRPSSTVAYKPEGYPSAPAHHGPPGHGASHQHGRPSYACSVHSAAPHSSSAHPHYHHHYHHQHVELISDTYTYSSRPPAENPGNYAAVPPESPSSFISQDCHSSGVNVIPVQDEQPSEAPELLMEELLDAAFQRQGSALNVLGSTLLDDARKGLSRVIDPGDDEDIQLFAVQLRRMDFSACESDYKRGGRDRIPCFALSYTGKDHMVGRFPFSEHQWENFRRVMSFLASSGIRQVRLWLDQCMWLRDTNLACWAHTGLVPYVIWPVVSLGYKIDTENRTIDSYERVWPFVEEAAGLLSLGVLTFSEISQNGEAMRHIVCFNQLSCLDLEVSILAIFHSICQGALNELQCSCPEDVMELVDMARFNMDNDFQDVVIGSNWRSRIAPVQRCPQSRPFKLSAKGKYFATCSTGKVPSIKSKRRRAD